MSNFDDFRKAAKISGFSFGMLVANTIDGHQILDVIQWGPKNRGKYISFERWDNTWGDLFILMSEVLSDESI